MRLNVNIATRPYEDVRNFVVRWGTLTLLFALVTAALVYYSIHNWRASSDVNRQIGRLRQEIATLEKERSEAIATLNKQENRTVVEQSKFLNSAIQRKALSWTRVFMDLERIMPNQLHVVSIKPELNKDNRLLLHLQVAGDSREKAIELVRRMEESTTFKNAELLSEASNKDKTKPDTVEFEITSYYVPAATEPALSPAKGPMKTTAMAKSGGQQ
jgi:type IV pilus assembly protein PilN